MIRSFLPVGQGAFYCERFRDLLEDKSINMVYDCGSSNGKVVIEREIAKSFRKGETIHALFISHFHDDHINGIPFLMKYCNVENIYLPVIDSADKVMLNLCNEIKMHIYTKSSSPEAYKGTLEYKMLEHPVRTIEQIWEGNDKDNSKRPKIYMVRSSNSDSNIGDNDHMDGDKDYIEYVNSGVNAITSILNDMENKSKSNLLLEWEFILHNFKQRERLEKLIDFFIDISSEEEPDTIYREYIETDDLSTFLSKVLEKIKDGIDKDALKKLKRAYSKIGGDLNTNSMTMFSGIKNGDVIGERMLCSCIYSGIDCCRRTAIIKCPCDCNHVCRRFIEDRLPCYWADITECGCNHIYKKPIGCLYLGDYDCKTVANWDSLEGAYSSYMNSIGCLKVPHHGSKYNFNKKLLDFNASYIISAGRTNKYRHPHADVIKEICMRGKCPWIVTEECRSGVDFIFCLKP